MPSKYFLSKIKTGSIRYSALMPKISFKISMPSVSLTEMKSKEFKEALIFSISSAEFSFKKTSLETPKLADNAILQQPSFT